MKVLVTGATGFTGSHTVPLLLKHDIQVRCLVRPTSNTGFLPVSQIELVYGDLDDQPSIQDALHGVDGLVNIASLGFGHTSNIVNAAIATGVQRAVFVSTTAIFTPLDAASKSVRVTAEDTIRQSGLAYTILRPTMIYGSSRDRNICRLINYLRQWPVLPVFGSGQYLQQPVYVEDVAAAIAQSLMTAKTIGKSYNISGGTVVTYNQLVETVSRLLGRNVRRFHLPATLFVSSLRTLERLSIPVPIKAEQILRLNEDKAFEYVEAARDFNYQPRALVEGLRLELQEMQLL